jgi:hypothetical protein
MIPIVTERAALDINQLFEFHGEQAAQQISSEYKILRLTNSSKRCDSRLPLCGKIFFEIIQLNFVFRKSIILQDRYLQSLQICQLK